MKNGPPKKLVGTITYEPLAGLDSNLVWFSRYFWVYGYFWEESIKNKMAAAAILKKVDMVVVGSF